MALSIRADRQAKIGAFEQNWPPKRAKAYAAASSIGSRVLDRLGKLGQNSPAATMPISTDVEPVRIYHFPPPAL
jgi:hypothetical protein